MKTITLTDGTIINIAYIVLIEQRDTDKGGCKIRVAHAELAHYYDDRTKKEILDLINKQ